MNPNAKDFIAYYCPVYDEPSHHLDYITVDHSLTWQKGYGHITVTVYNMRTTCVFKYYRAGHSYSQLAGISNEISFSDGGPAAPLQGHIALTGIPTEMRVMWTSGEGNESLIHVTRFKIRGRNIYGGGIFEHRFRLQSLNLCSKNTPQQVPFSVILKEN